MTPKINELLFEAKCRIYTSTNITRDFKDYFAEPLNALVSEISKIEETKPMNANFNLITANTLANLDIDDILYMQRDSETTVVRFGSIEFKDGIIYAGQVPYDLWGVFMDKYCEWAHRDTIKLEPWFVWRFDAEEIESVHNWAYQPSQGGWGMSVTLKDGTHYKGHVDDDCFQHLSKLKIKKQIIELIEQL